MVKNILEKLGFRKNKPEWRHYTVVCKNGVPKVYLDGKPFSGTYEVWKKQTSHSYQHGIED